MDLQITSEMKSLRGERNSVELLTQEENRKQKIHLNPLARPFNPLSIASATRQHAWG
jgi:hypothetical protein